MAASKRTSRDNIVARKELADGNVLVIQKVGRHYTVYEVPPQLGETPIWHADDINLAEARTVFADRLQADVCETY